MGSSVFVVVLEVEHLLDDEEGSVEGLLGVDLRLDDDFLFLFEAIRVRLDVEVDELLELLDLILKCLPVGDHLLLSVRGDDFALGDALLGLDNLVHLLLLVAESLALVVQEEVVDSGEVDLNLTFFVGVALGVFLDTHYLITWPI